MSKKNHVWVVESKDQAGRWRPWSYCGVTKMQALIEMKQVWDEGPTKDHRVTKYVPAKENE